MQSTYSLDGEAPFHFHDDSQNLFALSYQDVILSINEQRKRYSMSFTLDSSINALVSQAMTMQSQQVDAAAQVKVAKGIQSTQESIVMQLISSVGLTTYDQSGALQSVAAVGQKVNVQA